MMSLDSIFAALSMSDSDDIWIASDLSTVFLCILIVELVNRSDHVALKISQT